MEKTQSKEEWLTVIQEWKKSGLSQSKFCREKQIKLSTFIYHRKKTEIGQKSIPATPLRLPIPGGKNGDFRLPDRKGIFLEFSFNPDNEINFRFRIKF